MTELWYKITTEYGTTEITDYQQAMKCKAQGATVEKIFKETPRILSNEEKATRDKRLRKLGYIK